MKKALLPLAAALFLLAPAAPKATAYGTYDFTDNYYPDNTYTNAVGWTETYCDGTYDEFGSVTYYRYHQRINCSTNYTVSNCQEYNPSTGAWTIVSCPSETVTAQGRLRIPVGYM